MKIEQFSRILQHRLTGVGQAFTIPTSNDHTDETWTSSDLYIGEIGINVTDDSMFFRTNNGVIQVATGPKQTIGTPILWSYVDDTIQIGATVSPTAVVRNVSSFVDLGSSTLRFKDIYLGGSSDAFSIININNGFTIRNLNDSLITTVNGGSNGAVITMAPTASTALKVQPIHISSKSITMSDGGNQRVSIGTDGGSLSATDNTVVIAGKDVTLGLNADNVVYIGQGRGREFNSPNSLVIGGELVIAGVADDGTGVYNQSNLVKGQSRLTTVDALVNDIFTWNWIGKSVIQLKAKVLGMAIDDISLIYSNEIFVTAYSDGFIIGEPIIKEVSSFVDDVELTVGVDITSIDLKVKGSSLNNIQWLCDWEYQVLLNTN